MNSPKHRQVRNVDITCLLSKLIESSTDIGVDAEIIFRNVLNKYLKNVPYDQVHFNRSCLSYC